MLKRFNNVGGSTFFVIGFENVTMCSPILAVIYKYAQIEAFLCMSLLQKTATYFKASV